MLLYKLSKEKGLKFNMSENIFHYTSIENLLLILKSKSICFNSLENVDDLEEKETMDLKNFGRFYYVSCWNKSSKESIPLWKMYSQDMEGVRIELPKFPFKKQEYSKRQIYFNENKVEYINIDKLYKDTKMILLDGGIKLFDIEYTDNEKLLYPTIKNINSKNFLEYDFSKLGKYKRTNWSFQEECRYGVLLVPCSEECLNKTINLNKFDKNELKFVVNELIKLLENHNNVETCKRFYLEIDENALKQMKILLGPKITEAQEEIVKLIVKEYCPEIQISRSKLKIN